MRQLMPTPVDDPDLLEVYAHEAGAAAYVRANFVTTPDGAVTLNGVSEGLSSPADKTVFGTLRTVCDVVLVGAGTARAEGYRPARMGPERQEVRRSLGLDPIPPIALVSGSLDLDPSTELFTTAVARPLVFTSERAPSDRRTSLARVADVVTAGDNVVDVATVVRLLGERGLRRVLCEGGPRLFTEMLAAGVVDELCLTIAPTLAGAGHRRLTSELPLEAPLRWRLAGLLEDDGFLFTRYVRP